jgi:hypothetical protein
VCVQPVQPTPRAALLFRQTNQAAGASGVHGGRNASSGISRLIPFHIIFYCHFAITPFPSPARQLFRLMPLRHFISPWLIFSAADAISSAFRFRLISCAPLFHTLIITLYFRHYFADIIFDAFAFASIIAIIDTPFFIDCCFHFHFDIFIADAAILITPLIFRLLMFITPRCRFCRHFRHYFVTMPPFSFRHYFHAIFAELFSFTPLIIISH